MFAILQQADIVGKELSDKLKHLAEFRNKLVHAYATVPQEKIYHLYIQDIKVAHGFITIVQEYLQKHES